jgi:hypothetical protein
VCKRAIAGCFERRNEVYRCAQYTPTLCFWWYKMMIYCLDIHCLHANSPWASPCHIAFFFFFYKSQLNPYNIYFFSFTWYSWW